MIVKSDSIKSFSSLDDEISKGPDHLFEIFDYVLDDKPSEPAIVGILLQLITWSTSNDEKLKTDTKESLFTLFKGMSVASAMVCIEELISIASTAKKWQEKVQCLECIQDLVNIVGKKSSNLLPELVPVLTDLMWSTKKAIKKSARKTIKRACKNIENKDLKPFIPELISAIENPEEVLECVHKLAATTFVQTVDSGTLALVAPLLLRGFNKRNIALTRKCAVICENMGKLVEDTRAIEPFIPTLIPALDKARENVADIECRTVCDRAYKCLTTLGEEYLKNPGISLDIPVYVPENVSRYCQRIHNRGGSHEDLQSILKGYLNQEDITNMNVDGKAKEDVYTSQELDHDFLCNCTFSLAYGSKILLNSAKLQLVQGHRYGIVAQKSAGKTTLLKSIANYQIDGFPLASELKTVFVDTDVQGFKQDQDVLTFCQDVTGLSEEDCNKTLGDVGFTADMMQMSVTSLSGGWRMKLALARAMLRDADILLMDEPTNHMDVLNVQWVVDYLTGDSCKKVTSLIVSHDTGFLDKVATDIIHLNNLKLSYFTGNLSSFVEVFPSAKSYYDLTKSALKFYFPEPGPLEGVNSRGKTIMQMQGVSFRYPSANKDQLNNVSVRCSMASRVACVGANGAGKSTMIKLLTGELEATAGSVVKNPNLRFAYVAQHAFHHIEQHLSKTPNEYIQWRYAGGEDKEAMNKSTAKISDEELQIMKKPIEVIYEDEDGKKIKEKRVVEKIVSRRKSGKKLEYEVKWVSRSQDMNTWLDREYLCDLGFLKLLQELDRRLASLEGSYSRVLTQRNVEKHLENVGLEKELGTHNRISSLSGGQKVKVVLGACTWCQPHLIILDEPTNYLDREALGALATAINEFQGGVVLITHNKEFADTTTRETWVVANNTCDIKGDPEWSKYAQEAIELKNQEDLTDAAGNKIEKKRMPETLKPREKKKLMKSLKIKIKNDQDMTDFEELCANAWGIWE